MIVRYVRGLLCALFFVAGFSASSAYDMRDYWPNPAAGEQLLVQDATIAYGPEILSVLHRYRRGPIVSGVQTLQLDDYISTSGWIDQWELKPDATAGILEYADRYVGSRLVYKAGKEIKWGKTLSVNDVILSNPVEVDVAASSGVTAGPWNYGYNSLTIEEFIPSFTNDGGLVFSNVLKVYLYQSFCIDAACSYPAGQNIWKNRYWLAPGVGIVQTDYIAPDVRRDYAKTITRTVAMPNTP